MKKVLMIAAVAMTATAANAAGNFTGVNAGVHGGYGFGSAKDSATVKNGAGATTAAASKTNNMRGMLYGLHLGYNYDFGKMVAGVEGDYSFSNAKGHKNFSNGIRVEAKRKDSLGLAFKAGYKITDTLLLGAKAGISTTKYKFSATASNGFIHAHKRATAFVPGVFVEKLINDHVTVGAEYSYVASKKISANFKNAAGSISTSIKPRSHDMLVRVGYKF